MKKKPERYSFKKLTAFCKKPELKYIEDIKNSYEKSIKSQPKNKSSERVITAYETNTRFKVSKNSQERTRTKTEADEFSSTKTPFQKFMQQNKRDKEERSSKGKYNDKTKHFLETKNLNLKKLNLGSDLCTFQHMQTMSSRIHHLKRVKPRTVARIIALGRRMSRIGRGSRRQPWRSTSLKAWKTWN